MILLLSLIAPLALARPQQQTATPAALQGLDAYVQQVMHDWHVPGLAIAVVKDGKVVLVRGYGVRELGKPGAVDADTLFGIASNTKAFTVAALGTLVASGKLTWDTPVVDALKDFRLSSAYVTEHVTLRDLLTHRTGYCDPSMESTSDPSTMLHRVRYQKPDYGFRTTFCYNNLQYDAAGRFIPALTGQSWRDYVAAHLFQPLGMDRTVTTEAAIEKSSDVATPHGMVDGRLAAIHREWPHAADVLPADGAIWSSANDMSHWLQMLLADGKYDGKTVLDPSVVHTMETPQVLIQQARGHGTSYWIRVQMPGGSFHSYGLGFFIQHDDGRTLVWHPGDVDGMASVLAMVPDAHLGVMVLSNSQGDARFAIVTRVLQDMLDQPRHDIEPALLAAYKKYEVRHAAWVKALANTHVPGTRALLPLADYAGTYSDKLDGKARVLIDHGHLVLRLANPDYTGDLEPWHGNTFRVTWRYKFYGTDYATFDVNALGKP
ncbi:MAG TPA: serine hydrolase, partial [Rhodanobacter sp.]|nr:serine hydrolase [Rhodanobacter sp.]